MTEVDQNIGIFKFTIDNLKNPPTSRRSDKFSKIYVIDKAGFEVAQLHWGQTQGIKNKQAAFIQPPYSLTQSSLNPNEISEYEIKFYPTNDIPGTGTIHLWWPEQIKVDADAGCQVFTSRYFFDNCHIIPNEPAEDGIGGIINIMDIFVDQEQFNSQIIIKLWF